METTQSAPRMPLPIDVLPKAARRPADPKSPRPMRLMAAKGLGPFRGGALLTLLCQLAADADEEVASTARASLQGLPEAVLHSALEEADLHAAVLDAAARHVGERPGVLERVVTHPRVADATVARIARRAPEPLCERIATNQERILRAPAIAEALYHNERARMSTVDRLVELCARHGVRLAVPSFEQHVQALQGQLVPEPTAEPLPSDRLFEEALAHDADVEAVATEGEEGEEEVVERFLPLHHRIRQMSISEKIRLATIGDAAARSILVRDSNRLVAHAAATSPRMSETEAVGIAHSKEVNDEVLRILAGRREWTRNYELKKALVLNPKTPVGIALRFLAHLRESDLKQLARSRNVPTPIRTAAAQRMQQRRRR